MNFDLDPAKDAEVRPARRFGFADAVEIFAGPVVEWQDIRQDYGEIRMVATGQARGVFHTVVYTNRAETRHIITAWLASRKDRKAWHASV